jgi:hypothetical protein
MSANLYLANHPARFWRPLLRPQPAPSAWEEPVRLAAAVLPEGARVPGVDRLLEATLGEGQFGPGHWRLPRLRRLYHRLRPLLPRRLGLRARRAARRGFPLEWPIEDRYRRFLWATMNALLAQVGREQVPFLFFWPSGARYALVFTHDVETADGQRFVPAVAEREERLGLRSSFNFVAERCPLDLGLIRDLESRGFEVGLHGRPGAGGFRSPLSRRHPQRMQALDAEYGTACFDTDPFEPLPGGTMSTWPFLMGRLVQLPYTLTRDSTLMDVLGERGPLVWLRKAAYLERWFGMALLNTHPDHLRQPGRWDAYAALLETLRGRGGYWNAVPREVARWWRRRATAEVAGALDGARQGLLRRGAGGEVEVVPPAAEPTGGLACRP